ncbi:MAG: DinB family protein [Flavobacterium sp.]|nr:DinB family protein [Pedobacter sp.]
MTISEQTLSRFSTQHKIIKYYIDGLPPEAIYKRLSSEKWSIHEIIAYMCRYQHIFFSRIKSIVSEVNPMFNIYKPDEDPEFSFTESKTTGSLLHEIYRVRQDILNELDAVKQDAGSLTGIHEVLGKMDLSQWIEFFLLHESNQLFKIFKSAGNYWSFGANPENIRKTPMRTPMDELAGY